MTKITPLVLSLCLAGSLAHAGWINDTVNRSGNHSTESVLGQGRTGGGSDSGDGRVSVTVTVEPRKAPAKDEIKEPPEAAAEEKDATKPIADVPTAKPVPPVPPSPVR